MARSRPPTADGRSSGRPWQRPPAHPRRWHAAGLALALAIAPWLAQAAEPALSPALYRHLTEIRQLLDSGASARAVPRLEQLADAGQDSDYERAVVLQHLGYARLDLGRDGPAAEALQAALALAALPPGTTQELRYLVAQLQIRQGGYGAGLALLETWLQAEAQPPATAYLLAAHAALQAGRKGRGAEHLARAIARSDAPEPGWFELLAATYQELGRARQAVATLHRAVARFPAEARLWQRLAAIHQLQGDAQHALAVLVLAYHQERLPEGEHLRLVSLFAQLGAPERAARLLRAWRDAGRVAGDYANLKLEADLWLLARERASAREVLALADGQARDGRVQLLLGQLAYDAEDWPGAIAALQQALRRGGLANPGSARLLLGISAVHQGDAALARRALEQAGAQSALRAQADYWLGRLDATPAE